MPSSYQILTCSNRTPTEAEPYYWPRHFWKSLHRHGADALNLWPEGQEWHGLMGKPRVLRKWLRNAPQSLGCVISCDCWDLIFQSDPGAIVSEWEAIGRPWIAGAERNLFPPADESKWTKCASSMRFLNSGFIIATPRDMLAVLESMNLDAIPDDHVAPNGDHINPNDQEYFQQEFLKQPIPMRLDTEVKLCLNLHEVKECELSLHHEGMVRFLETGTFPGVLHWNGGSKSADFRDPVLKHLGILS